MKSLITLIALFLLLISLAHSSSSVTANKSHHELGFNFALKRIIYAEGQQNSASVELNNESQYVYLMSATILLNNPTTDLPIKETKAEETPFIILPPLFKFEPKSSYSWRIYHINDTENTQKLPQDRESLFWVAIQALPKTNKDNKGVVLTPTFYFKLLYRPKSIAEIETRQVMHKVSVNKTSDSIYIENNSPLYMTFNTLNVGNVEIKNNGRLVMVKPFSTKKLSISPNILGCVTWELSDENLFPLLNND